MVAVHTETIRTFGGKIIGYVDTDSEGNQQARSFGGKILGSYTKRFNTTNEFGGRIIANGNIVASLITNPQYNPDYQP